MLVPVPSEPGEMIRLLVRCLATWRITELVVEDELTRLLREAVAKRWPGSKAAYLVTCPSCVSVWAAAAGLILPEWACTVLALSGANMLVNEVRDHASASALQRRMTGGPVRREGEGAEVQRA